MVEELGFDIGGILSDEEANKLFEEQVEVEEPEKPEEQEEKENDPTEEEEETQTPERVGVEENEDGTNAIVQEGDGSSPSIYSSIASALKNDGIFPDFEDSDIESLKTPEDFAELIEKAKAKAVEESLSEVQKRVNAALGNGVEPDTVRQYEQTIQYLDSINEEALSAESDEGENLRKQIIWNDLINRGYTEEKARKELEKSFKAGSDVEDAKDALEALTKYYKEGYEKVQNEAKKQADAARESQKKQVEDFKKMVLDNDVTIGETKLDKSTRQKVYDAVLKPVYKDPDTGKLLTAVQKFQKEQPLEFLKQLGMWYVLTDGGKNTEGFTKEQLRVEKNKSIKELSRKINSTSLKTDGSLRYASGSTGDSDPLLSDGWKVGW